MAAVDVEKFTADKLDCDNWLTWKFQISTILKAKGLFGYVDGSEALASDASEDDRSAFRKRSHKAMAIIAMAITTPQLYLITSCDNPADAWKALKDHFESDTIGNKLFLTKAYFRCEMKETSSVQSHLKYMRELTYRLAALGEPVSEEYQVATLLGSLPEPYAMLVTVLESQSDAGLSLKFVQRCILNEEEKLFGQHRRPNQGYSVLDEKIKRVTRRNVEFDESYSDRIKEDVSPSKFNVDIDFDSVGDAEPENAEVDSVGAIEPQTSRPKRAIKPPCRFGYDEYADMISEAEHVGVAYSVSEITEPETIESENPQEWKSAPDNHSSLQENETINVMEPPSAVKPTECCWVLKVRYGNDGNDGNIERSKGCVTVKGCKQKCGINCNEASRSIMWFSICALLAELLIKMLPRPRLKEFGAGNKMTSAHCCNQVGVLKYCDCSMVCSYVVTTPCVFC